METRLVVRYAVPPKVSYVFRVINGKETKIKIVRDSSICRFFTNDETFIFGNTVFASGNVVTKRMFTRALDKLSQCSKDGKWKHLWKHLTRRQ